MSRNNGFRELTPDEFILMLTGREGEILKGGQNKTPATLYFGIPHDANIGCYPAEVRVLNPDGLMVRVKFQEPYKGTCLSIKRGEISSFGGGQWYTTV